jgi:ribosomal protein L29
MKLVERKIREDSHREIEAEIRQLKVELCELKQQVTVKSPSQEEDPDIPFDSKDSGILSGF